MRHKEPSTVLKKLMSSSRLLVYLGGRKKIIKCDSRKYKKLKEKEHGGIGRKLLWLQLPEVSSGRLSQWALLGSGGSLGPNPVSPEFYGGGNGVLDELCTSVFVGTIDGPTWQAAPDRWGHLPGQR